MGDRGHNRHGPQRGGSAVPLSRGELGVCLTQCGLGRGLLPYQVSSSSIQPFDHNRHEPKTGGCAPFRVELRPHLAQRHLAEVYLRAKWHLEPSSPLATMHMAKNWVVAVPFFLGELGPHKTQNRLGGGLPPYQVTS